MSADGTQKLSRDDMIGIAASEKKTRAVGATLFLVYDLMGGGLQFFFSWEAHRAAEPITACRNDGILFDCRVPWQDYSRLFTRVLGKSKLASLLFTSGSTFHIVLGYVLTILPYTVRGSRAPRRLVARQSAHGTPVK